MQTLELENYGTVEMTSGEQLLIEGGHNPLLRRVIIWLGEQIASWGVGATADAAVEQASSGGGGGNTHMNSMNAAGDPS